MTWTLMIAFLEITDLYEVETLSKQRWVFWVIASDPRVVLLETA